MPSSASPWRCPATARGASRPSCAGAVGSSIASACSASCAKTICCACGESDACARPIPGTGWTVYPNLVPELKLSGLNQLWVADITYIRLRREFVYLAVLLDAYSRRCIGWSLGRTLEAELTLAALRMALAKRDVGPALVHHSDRGVQYATGDYTALLAEHGIAISMSRKASPNDNAKAESFIKTPKYEEVWPVRVRQLRRGAAAHRGVHRARLQRKRLHSALDYRPPNEYEQWWLHQQTPQGVAG